MSKTDSRIIFHPSTKQQQNFRQYFDMANADPFKRSSAKYIRKYGIVTSVQAPSAPAPPSELHKLMVQMYTDAKQRRDRDPNDVDRTTYLLFNDGKWPMTRDQFEDVMARLAHDFVHGMRWSVGEMYHPDCFPLFLDIDFKADIVQHFLRDEEERIRMFNDIMETCHASIVEYFRQIVQVLAIRSIVSVKPAQGLGAGAHVVIHSLKVQEPDDTTGARRCLVDVNEAHEIYDMMLEKLQTVYPHLAPDVLGKIVDKEVYKNGGNLRMNYTTKANACYTCTLVDKACQQHQAKLAAVERKVQLIKKAPAQYFGKRYGPDAVTHRTRNIIKYRVIRTNVCCDFLLPNHEEKSADVLRAEYRNRIQFADNMRTYVIMDDEVFWPAMTKYLQEREAPIPPLLQNAKEQEQCEECHGLKYTFPENSIYKPAYVYVYENGGTDITQWPKDESIAAILSSLKQTTLHVTEDELSQVIRERALRRGAMEAQNGLEREENSDHHVVKVIDSSMEQQESIDLTLFLWRCAHGAYANIQIQKIQFRVSSKFAANVEKKVKQERKNMKKRMAELGTNVRLTQNYAELGYYENINKVHCIYVTVQPSSPGAHYCHIAAGRNHQSNHIFFEIESNGTCNQRCHDPKCAGHKYYVGVLDSALHSKLFTSRNSTIYNPVKAVRTDVTVNAKRDNPDLIMSIIKNLELYYRQILDDESPARLEEEERAAEQLRQEQRRQRAENAARREASGARRRQAQATAASSSSSSSSSGTSSSSSRVRPSQDDDEDDPEL